MHTHVGGSNGMISQRGGRFKVVYQGRARSPVKTCADPLFAVHFLFITRPQPSTHADYPKHGDAPVMCAPWQPS